VDVSDGCVGRKDLVVVVGIHVEDPIVILCLIHIVTRKDTFHIAFLLDFNVVN